jgi:HK97 family phage portal protein
MLINRNTRGAVVELIPVHPEKVSITSDDLGINIFYTVGGETYRQGVGILHIKNLSIANSAWGISPITQNRRTLLMGVNAEQFGADFYKYGLNLSGVIELPAGPGKIDADEAERMRKQFSAKHSGSTGSSAVGVLTGGAQWKQITLSPADAQFLESRKYTAVQVANIFHVPAYMVDPSVTSTWGTGIAEQNQMLVDAALEPLATRIETAISTFLLPTNQYMKFNMDELLRGDLETRTKVLAQQIQNGLIAPNEGRERLNLEPDTNPGSNDLQLPLYIGSIADAKAKAAMDLELQKAQIEAAKQTGQPPGAQGGTN